MLRCCHETTVQLIDLVLVLYHVHLCRRFFQSARIDDVAITIKQIMRQARRLDIQSEKIS